MNDLSITEYKENITNMIFSIRGKFVMLDSHLADLYEVETKSLNRAVKRNLNRFPESFMFQLNKDEFETLRYQFGTSNLTETLRYQFGTSNERGGRRYLPYVFTEQGVSMLSAVLNSDTAIQMSIRIMDAFVEMRHYLINNALLFQRMDNLEKKQINTENKVLLLLDSLEKKGLKPKQGVFYDGQVFDAWNFISNLIRKAENQIVLIDNYIDDSVLNLFAKKQPDVSVEVFTKSITIQLRTDAEKFNLQYGKLRINKFDKAHDRFLMIDHKEVYYIGASLKDLGKKWFAFSKMDKSGLKIFEKLRI